MSLEKEIRIAKLQILFGIAVATLALYNIIRYPIYDFWELLLAPLFIVVWYLGAISIRQTIEEEKEEE